MSAKLYRGKWRSESAYQSYRARQIRQELFEMLGPWCAECGADLRERAWEVNHIYRREWKPRELSYYRRQLRYMREAREGLVNLMCDTPCNASYRPLPRPTQETSSNNPF